MISNVRKVIIQGITGKEGLKHTQRMLKCGTNIVGGVNPKKAGETLKFFDFDNNNVDIKVFSSCSQAVKEIGANTSVVFVPPMFAKDAVIEAINAELELIVVITEGIPQKDTIYFQEYAHLKSIQSGKKIQILGPNCPGMVEFNQEHFEKSCNLGIIPDGLCKKFGRIGLVSKSGTLTYQVMNALKDIGFKKCVGIGGDVTPGINFIDVLKDFNSDDDIEGVIIIGEIGGDLEEKAANFLQCNESINFKFCVSYIAGRWAPVGKTMGHAGAIMTNDSGTAYSKCEALKKVSECVNSISEIVAYLENLSK